MINIVGTRAKFNYNNRLLKNANYQRIRQKVRFTAKAIKFIPIFQNKRRFLLFQLILQFYVFSGLIC